MQNLPWYNMHITHTERQKLNYERQKNQGVLRERKQ